MQIDMMKGDAVVTGTKNHIHVQLKMPCRTLSSAVLNGGIVTADHVVNMQVPKRSTITELPAISLQSYCMENRWQGVAVGMMTAASMNSFRMMSRVVQNVEIAVLVTSGMSNPRRAGDKADYPYMTDNVEEAGTINIMAFTSAHLSDAALAEMLMVVTEAKSAALQHIGIRSMVSDQIATGTGTDAVAVTAGNGPESVRYCGKHMLFGEVLGELTINAVTSSVVDIDSRTIE